MKGETNLFYKLSYSLFLAVSFALLLSISFKNSGKNTSASLHQGPATGAKLSFDYIGAVRSYPNNNLPEKGFYQAFNKVKSDRAKKKNPNSPVWNTLGPVNIGGRTLALAIHPSNPNTVFAGSASGGLWKSTTGGSGLNAWEYVSTGFPVLGVAAIAIDPQNPDLMYIGTGESYGTEVNMPGIGPVRTTRGSYGIGILKSSDGGITWEKSLDWTLDQRRAVQKIQVNPLRSNSIWAATTEGTYRSLDGGNTWELVHNVRMATDIVINPADTNIVFTANGGMGSPGNGIYRTQDAGNSFTKMDLAASGGPSNFLGKAVLDISLSDPDIVMASIGNSNGSHTGVTWLMKTVDGGDSWNLEFASNSIYATFQGWYSHAIAIHPTDPQKIWAAGQPQEYYYSDNGGNNLSRINTSSANPYNGTGQYSVYPFLFVWADHHDIIFHPTNVDIIYFVSDGGIFRTTDGGATFENCNSGYQTVQFYNGVSNSDTNESLMLGGLQDNNSIIYEGSLNWRRAFAGDGSWTALNQDDNNIAYLSGQYGQPAVSDQLFNDGQFGDGLIHPGFDVFPTNETNFITPLILSPSDNKTLYLGGEKILKSSDDGANWVITNSGKALDGNAMSAMAASHQNLNTVYAASSPKATRPNVYKTHNGGDSWIRITQNLPDRFPTDLAVDPLNDRNVYITFGGFGSSHAFKSDNGGETWINIGSGLPDVPTWAITVDPEYPDHIYVGNEIGVFQSLDGGKSWENINGNLPDAIFAMDLIISHSNRTLRLASHGNGAYEMSLPDLPDETGAVPESFTLFQNYPNPFNPSTTISFELSEPAGVNLSVFDVSGRLVRTLIDESRGRGEHTTVFNSDGLASGVYFYRLLVGNETASKKMTVIK